MTATVVLQALLAAIAVVMGVWLWLVWLLTL